MKSLRGLYAVTDSALLTAERLVEAVGEAIAGGATLIQYRDKSGDRALRYAQANALQTLCRSCRVPLIINDDVQLAKDIGADGVHLGKNDATITDTRQRLGPDALIGISCYNSIALAEAAANAGADYVAFGRFFPSTTKPLAVPADIALLNQARTRTNIPICAIGGITQNNGDQLVRQGADLLAVIHGVFGQPDVKAAAAAFVPLFER